MYNKNRRGPRPPQFIAARPESYPFIDRDVQIRQIRPIRQIGFKPNI